MPVIVIPGKNIYFPSRSVLVRQLKMIVLPDAFLTLISWAGLSVAYFGETRVLEGVNVTGGQNIPVNPEIVFEAGDK